MSTKRPAAKRKLKDIDFSNEGAHVALVSKDQGGPASGHDYALVIKANTSPEFIEKVQSVTLTMELPDFLQKFFYLWEEDAEALAYLMGYVEPVENQTQESADEFQNWCAERIGSMATFKSLKDEASRTEVLANLNEDQYVALIKDQEMIEKAMCGGRKKTVKAEDANVDPQTEEVKPEDTPKVETVSKAQFDEIQKAFDSIKTELEKANNTIAEYVRKEKEALKKARFEQVLAAVADADKANTLFKALDLIQDEKEFQAIVKTLGEMTALQNQSELFKEAGVEAQGSEEIEEESSVAKLLKAKYQPKS